MRTTLTLTSGGEISVYLALEGIIPATAGSGRETERPEAPHGQDKTSIAIAYGIDIVPRDRNCQEGCQHACSSGLIPWGTDIPMSEYRSKKSIRVNSTYGARVVNMPGFPAQGSQKEGSQIEIGTSILDYPSRPVLKWSDLQAADKLFTNRNSYADNSAFCHGRALN